jgi:hypothetical protein
VTAGYKMVEIKKNIKKNKNYTEQSTPKSQLSCPIWKSCLDNEEKAIIRAGREYYLESIKQKGKKDRWMRWRTIHQ